MYKFKRVGLILSFLAIYPFMSPLFAAPLGKRDIAKLHVKRWALVEVRSRTGEITSVSEICGSKIYEPKIDFSTNGKVSGSLCCNSFSGKYNISPGSNDILIYDLGMTMVGCVPETKLDDSVFLSILDGIYRVEVADSELRLSSAVGDGIWIYRAVTSEVAPITKDGSGQKTVK